MYNIAVNDVKTTTGGNVRKVLLQSGMDPRTIPKHRFSDWRVYKSADTWTVPLVSSLLLLRSDSWEVEEECLEDAEIKFMLEAICTT